jgi:DNA-binding NarL/FixJ family response regulator
MRPTNRSGPRARPKGNPGGSATALPSMDRPASVAITPAEGRVLAALRRGLSNRAIAAALVLSHRTVECHVSHLLAKSGCRNRTQLLLWTLTER